MEKIKHTHTCEEALIKIIITTWRSERITTQMYARQVLNYELTFDCGS